MRPLPLKKALANVSRCCHLLVLEARMRIQTAATHALGAALLTFFVAAGASAAPGLSVGTASTPAGTEVNIPITFDAGATSVALVDFNLTLPVALSTVSVTAGPIATAAGKSVSTNFSGGVLKILV